MTLLSILVACTKTDSDYSKRELVLSQSNLNALPLDLGAYKNLKRLYVDANQLKEIPQSTFSNLKSLEELDLSYNQLTSLPDNIAKATQLELLDLSNNAFEALPKGVLALKNLKTLNIRNNKIKVLPEEIKYLDKLEIIYLAGNALDPNQRALYRSWLPRTKFIWAEIKSE